MWIKTEDSISYHKADVLHSFVGFTADVARYHPQALRAEACCYREQIDLEPQLVVSCFKGV